VHGDNLKSIYDSLAGVICNPEWVVQGETAKEPGIENVGLHVILKKLAKHDKDKMEEEPSFGESIFSTVEDDTVSFRAMKLKIYAN
jgi:hypothetical protein